MNFRKIFLSSFSVIALILLYFVVVYLLKNTISVNSTENTRVLVYSLPENSLVLESEENLFHQFRLGRGKYTIEVVKENSSTKKTVDLGFIEKLELDITPDQLLSSVKTSPQKVKNIGLYNNSVVGLQDASTILVNELGEIIYSQFESPIEKIVFANNNDFGEIKKNGNFNYTRNLVPRTFHLAQSESNPNNPTVDVDFNNEKNVFCVLLQDGSVFSVDYEGIKTNDFTVDEKNNLIRCEGDTTVVGLYARFSDGEEKTGTTSGSITVYKNKDELFTVDSVLLNALDVIDSSNFIYTDDKTVYSYEINNEKRTPQQNIISLNEHALFVNRISGFIYVFDEESAWELDIQNSLSKKVAYGYNFRAVNSVGTNSAGELIYSIDSRSFDFGIYKLTKNTELSETIEKIEKTLPKKDYFYSAEYVIVGDTVKVTVSVFGDIPSTPASKELAKQKAQAFINSLELNSSVEVIYK